MIRLKTLKKLLLVLLLGIPEHLFSQSYEKEYVSFFAWEVKQIDEFIERFNNDSTLIKQYYLKQSISSPLTREKLIKSLFNAERTNWNYSEITSFIKEVNNNTKPIYIDLYNDNWYANVICSVKWNSKPETVLLKLKIQRLPNGSSKWVVTDVKASFLEQGIVAGKNATVSKLPFLPKPIDIKASLNPLSHAIDFSNIDLITKIPKNLSNYIIRSDRNSADFCLFIEECLNDRLKIISVNSITYNFFQIKGWEMEIRQYNRQSKNSGWLISKLIKLPS